MEINKDKLLKRYMRNSPSKWKLQGFAMLPNRLLFDEKLSRSSLLVFWILTIHLFKGKEYCYPSLPTISKEAHCSKPTAIKAIKELEMLGYLQVDRTETGRRNKYYLKVF